MFSAFGVDHGEISKAAAATVGGRTIQGLKPLSSDRAQYVKTSLRTTGSKPKTNAQFATRANAEQRLGALAGRQRHRENYPGSKKLKGFPQRQLP